MAGTLSLVAWASEGFRTSHTAAEAADAATDDIWKALGKPPRVESVKQLAQILDDQSSPPDRIQIIGHGTPGFLALAYHWDQIYAGSNVGPVYALDSNPYAYGVLKKRVKPTTEVWLLGCLVGSDAAPGNSFSDGPTLLYDLARMWGNRVAGATELVSETSFDAHGDYIGALVDNTGAKTPGSVNLDPVPVSAEHAVEFLQLRAIPSLGPYGRRGAPALSPTDRVTLAHAFAREVEFARPPLVLDELQFDVTIANVQTTAAIVAAGRYLRVGRGDATRWLARRPDDLVSLDIWIANMLARAIG